MKTAMRMAALVMLAVVAATTYQAWAAAQPAASIRPIPVETTLGPDQGGEGDTTLLTYNCTGGIQVMLPQEVAQKSQTIVIVVYTGVDEYKVRCKLVGPEAKDEAHEGIGIQGAPEEATSDLQKTTVTPQSLATENAEDSMKGEETIVDTSTTVKQTREPAITQAATPQAEEPEKALATSTSPQPLLTPGESPSQVSQQAAVEERLMITLVGGIIAGLVALAVWRILLS